jgi:hypothetical protein
METPMSNLWLAGGLWSLGLLGSCADQALTPLQLDAAQSFVEGINAAPETVAFRGVRHWQIGGEAFDEPLDMLFTELVKADGQGGFQLELLNYQVNGAELNQPFGELYQIRQGFLFRYRDPQVLDFQRLMNNYQLIDGGQSKTIAERPAFELILAPRKKFKTGSTYSIWVDVETSLITGLSEWNQDGELLVRFEYSTLELGMPDASGFQPFESAVDQDLVEGVADWVDLLGHAVLEPTYVPRGFGLLESRKTQAPGEAPWAMLTYTDGIQPLFFLYRSNLIVASSSAGGDISGTNLDSGQVLGEQNLEGKILHVNAAGWNVLQGQLGEQHEFMAVGRMHPDHLQLMIETAMP